MPRLAAVSKQRKKIVTINATVHERAQGAKIIVHVQCGANVHQGSMFTSAPDCQRHE